MRRLVLLTMLAVAFLAGCGTQTIDATSSNTGASAEQGAGPAGSGGTDLTPATLRFEATAADGSAFDPTTLAGKPVVFWFWAPWCPTCRAQAGGVQHLAEQYGDEVNIVGVGSLDSEGAILDFAEAMPQITQLVDPDGAVWRHFGVTAQSTYLVLDQHGGTVGQGYLDDDDLATVVAQLAG